MKTKRRIFGVLVALILSAVLAVFAASAESEVGTKTPILKGYSLSLEENVYVLYAVDFGTLSEGAEYGMLVWEEDWQENENFVLPEAFTHEYSELAVDLKSAGKLEVNGAECEIFEYTGLAARQMTDYVYAVPYIKNVGDTAYTYGEVTKYSILQYTLGSAATEANEKLLDTMLDYGAKAQGYFDYKTDRLANEKYVLANLEGAEFDDGFSVATLKPGEELNHTVTSSVTPLMSGTPVKWYISYADGRAEFLDLDSLDSFVAPDESFTLSQSTILIDQNYDSLTEGKYTGDSVFAASNKGDSRYTVTTDPNGGNYIYHTKASGSGNDSQIYINKNKFDLQDRLYDSTTGSFAHSKKLTVSIDLARTEEAVAKIYFSLRHYNPDGDADSKRLFGINTDGSVYLGESTELIVGNLSTDWQHFSFVVDFEAGDVEGANNVFAYRGGFLVGQTRVDFFNTDTFLTHTDDSERFDVSIHSKGTDAGELLFDSLTFSTGETPTNDKARGLINYVVASGVALPNNSPREYVVGSDVTLPTLTREGYEFVGWYTSASMTEDSKVTELDTSKRGIITLYAKFAASDTLVETLISTNDAFDTSLFYIVNTWNSYNIEGNDDYPLADFAEDRTLSEIVLLDTSVYEPPVTPEGKQHPYLFFTSDEIDGIRQALASPEFAATAEKFWSYANAADFDGMFSDNTGKHTTPDDSAYDIDIFKVLEAKAFAYVITGDAYYGYQAIIGAKNAMLTLNYTYKNSSDSYHGASRTMVAVAKVYDWCYDLMSKKDKTEIILGVQNRLCPALEFNFFQVEQNLKSTAPNHKKVLSGHATGPQLLRDYPTVALAFYNEVPSWWDFFGGRYFEEYKLYLDFTYSGGWAPQGTAGYGTSKYFVSLWTAWIIRSSCDHTISYATEEGGARQAAYFLNSHIMPNGRYFSTGDGGRYPNGSKIDYAYMVLAAAFYKDPALEAFARHFTNGYSTWSYDQTSEMTAPMTLVFGSFFADNIPEGEYESLGDGTDLLQYFDTPNGFMSARNSWGEDAAATIMKIGEYTAFNHDIPDFGTFQIYYKGLLAATSGSYEKYGSAEHKYYLQSTISQNGLLIYNPEYASSDSTATENYYYSGSQRKGSSGNTYEDWLGNNPIMGEVTGHEVGYNSDGSSKYAYIAGDITAAYAEDTVDYVGRRMLTVFTGNPDYPMLFFVFDRITSDSANFPKSFLLHTVNEPTVDESNKTAVITDGEGKLVLHSVFGADSIRKIGGEGYAYWINDYDENGNLTGGKNCLDWSDSDNYDKLWGRIELNTVGNLTDSLLTAMYATDSTNESYLEVEGIEASNAKGAKILDNYVIFVDQNERHIGEITFTSSGTGLYNYYVSGIFEGEWNVYVDGSFITTASATEDGGFLSFVAPAGEIEIKPNVEIYNINYNTDGGTLPEDAPTEFSPADETLLPTPTKDSAAFLGWYTSPTFASESKITSIPAGTSADITIYAKWSVTIIDEDYSNATLSITSGKKTVNGITYNVNNSTGASFEAKTENDESYLEWQVGSKGSQFAKSGSTISTLEDSAISYEFTFSKNGDSTLTNFYMRTYTSVDVNGNSISTNYIYLFKVVGGAVYLTDNAEGSVQSTDIKIAEVGDEKTTVRIVLDFAAMQVKAYDSDGGLIQAIDLEIPESSGANDGTEYQKTFTDYLFFAKAVSPYSTAINFYEIKVWGGNVFEA